MNRFIPLVAALATLAAPSVALANAEGPGTPQATAANATFLASAPAPATGGGICVIDTGVDTDTDLGPALAGRVAQIGGVLGDPSDMGAISDTGDTLPKHGTYVAGVIASQVDGVGTSGIWPAAKIYSNRVFAGGAGAAVNDYIRAISWCTVQPGTKVINLSLSGLGTATTSQRANLSNKILEARSAPHNLNVVAAAGNNGSTSTVGYPALADGVFAVGATDASGVLAPFSNSGLGLDISTLGTDTCVTTGHGTHLAEASGTSFAAPVVSAILAALRSYDPALTPDQAETLLTANADIVGGAKVLNAARAFRADSVVAALAGDTPVLGRDAAAANACEPPGSPSPAAANDGANSRVSKPTQTTPDPDVVVVTPTATPAPAIDLPLPDAVTHRGHVLRAPILRSLAQSRGVLTLRIGGYEARSRVLCRVVSRARGKSRSMTFVRRSATLHLHVSRWTSIRVWLERPGGARSRPLMIRPNSEF